MLGVECGEPVKRNGRQCALANHPPCSSKITGEHFISRSVLKQISETNVVRVVGLPWAKEMKRVGIEALTANILCDHHNSILSPLDTIAGLFFEAMKSAYGIVEGTISKSAQFSFNGFEIEKWFLKVCFGLWEGNLIDNGGRNVHGPSPSIWSDILLDKCEFPAKWGLYLQDSSDYEFIDSNSLAISVNSLLTGEITGVSFTLAGARFNLVLSDGTFPRQLGIHRPCALVMGRQPIAHRIALNWIGEPFNKAVCMTLLSEQEITDVTGRLPPPRV